MELWESRFSSWSLLALGLEKGFLITVDRGGITAASVPPGDLVSPEGQERLVTPQ